MTTRNTPLLASMRYLAIAIPLAACSPAPGELKPQDPQTSDHPSRSFFSRLFSDDASLPLPEARMVTRDSICAPYLGNTRLTAEDEATVDIATGDLWQRVREGMTLDHSVSDPRVDKEIAFYRKNSRLLRLITQHASLYMYHVVDELDQRDMPLELALIPALESTYNPTARSPGGAIGMWQFMPGTARVYGLGVSNNFDERRDVVESTRAALDYFTRLHRKLGGDWLNAVASYNAGELNIIAAINRNERQGKPTDFWHLGLRAPTSHYVPRLIALAKIIADPQRYGVDLEPIANAPAFASITMDARANLTQTASLAGVSTQQLFELNPGLNRNALPRGSYTLHVPYDKKPRFEVAMNQVRSQSPSTPQYVASSHAAQTPAREANGKQVYVVKSGDNLWRISRELKVAVTDIAKWNRLTSNSSLRTGQRLVIFREQAPTATLVSKQNPTAVSKNDSSTRTVGYSVKSGDSLALIADRFDVKVDDILRWNTLDKKELLKPGQKLTLQLEN